MTREETKKILMGISCSYPNFKPNVPLDFMIDIWTDDLIDYSYEQVYTALKTFKATDKSGFAPSVGQLIDKIHIVKELPNELSEMEVWGMVYKAICDSNYHAKEHFENFPEIVQTIVGSPNQLKEWALMETDTVQSVVQSNLMRSYKTRQAQEKQINRLPSDIKKKIGIVGNTTIGIESF